MTYSSVVAYSSFPVHFLPNGRYDITFTDQTKIISLLTPTHYYITSSLLTSHPRFTRFQSKMHLILLKNGQE